jgi:hypothetical protein
VQEVRLSQNPLTDSGNGVAPRYMLIAHLGKITSLNGSQVKPRERRDAEISHSGFLHRMQSQIFVLMKMIFLYDNAQICAPCTEHHAEKRHGRDHEISPQV